MRFLVSFKELWVVLHLWVYRSTYLKNQHDEFCRRWKCTIDNRQIHPGSSPIVLRHKSCTREEIAQMHQPCVFLYGYPTPNLSDNSFLCPQKIPVIPWYKSQIFMWFIEWQTHLDLIFWEIISLCSVLHCESLQNENIDIKFRSKTKLFVSEHNISYIIHLLYIFLKSDYFSYCLMIKMHGETYM